MHACRSTLEDPTDAVAEALGWKAAVKPNPGVLGAIRRKSDLFFHRFRPANSTYLFGFRKHEQGQNAKEMATFDPIVEAADQEITRIKKTPAAMFAIAINTKLEKREPKPTLPVPTFDVDPSLEMSLWAETPLLGKPTQMSWDAKGRLWVACTPIYPQIEPGAHPDDKVVIIEDTDRDGKADKSTTFVDDLLIPSGVVVDTVPGPDGKVIDACYVGASTELLHLADTDGDGRADQRRVVFSGFGTEDTHHTLHTLRWGPDGRMYFSQSVYIHSHLETPWGMVRLNAGGVFAYDPNSERVEVFSKGLWNTWGHAWDRWGQSFMTDGAGSNGIAWAFPGATFNPSEGARKVMPTVSPGSYPKFAGLEIVHSALFPADWQGTAVTCDFRAHRIVRFAIEDLSGAGTAKKQSSEGKPAKSGYVTRELPDVARTADVAFRPIDVRLGPDGALYIADWSNPVINHGEVDFRDQRRDHVHGRIWRVAPKGSKNLTFGFRAPGYVAMEPQGKPYQMRSRAREEKMGVTFADDVLNGSISLVGSIKHNDPRVRLEGMRGWAESRRDGAVNAILDAAQNAPADDPHYEFAAWRSINDVAKLWVEALESGNWVANTEEKQKQLAWGLGAIRPELASSAMSRLFAAGKVPVDGSGPWFELLGQVGGAKELQPLMDGLLAATKVGGSDGKALAEEKHKFTAADANRRAAAALAAAARRGVRPEGAPKGDELFRHAPADALPDVLRLAGLWKQDIPAALVAHVSPKQSGAVLDAAFEALRALATPTAAKYLNAFIEPSQAASINDPALQKALETADAGIRSRALVALAAFRPQDAEKALTPVVLATAEKDLLPLWRELFRNTGFADRFAGNVPKDLPPQAYAAALRATREMGRKGDKLAASLKPFAGGEQKAAPQDFTSMASFVKRDGDPARGEEIYRRTALACVTCHAIGGAGGKVGPELGTIGASAPLDYIIESTLVPAAKVKEGYHGVSLTLKDGSVAAGVLVRETPDSVVLRNAIGQEQTVGKNGITKRENIGSLMPAGLVDQLKDRERLDLFAFMAQLGKAGVYDASKATVARTWWLSAQANSVPEKIPAEAMPVYTNVDGFLPAERLTGALSLVTQGTAKAIAATRLNAPSAGKVRLNLAGVREVWLDGKPLPVASEPSPTVELTAGDHILSVSVDPASVPPALRAEAEGVRFLTE